MSFIDYTLCSFFKKSIAKKERQGLKPAEAPLLSGEAFDWCNKENLTPILNYIREL